METEVGKTYSIRMVHFNSGDISDVLATKREDGFFEVVNTNNKSFLHINFINQHVVSCEKITLTSNVYYKMSRFSLVRCLPDDYECEGVK